MANENSSNKPDFEIRSGKIRGSVWGKRENGKNGSYINYSIKIEKSYNDGKQWKETNFFFPDELPRVAAISDAIYKKITLQITEGGK